MTLPFLGMAAHDVHSAALRERFNNARADAPFFPLSEIATDPVDVTLAEPLRRGWTEGPYSELVLFPPWRQSFLPMGAEWIHCSLNLPFRGRP